MSENEKYTDVKANAEALDDAAMEEVSGGAYYYEHIWNKAADVRFIFYPGDEVRIRSGLYFITSRARIIRCEVGPETNNASGAVTGYKDTYIVEALDAKPGDFSYFYKPVGRGDIVMDDAL